MPMRNSSLMQRILNIGENGLTVAVIVLVTFPFLAIGSAFLLFGPVAPLFWCNNDVLAVQLSPTGSHKAVVFVRNCGAITPYQTHVSVLPRFVPLGPRSGNTWVADGDHGRAPVAAWGGPEVHVDWVTPDTVRLRHHPSARVFQADSVVRGIRVAYVREGA